MLELDFYFFFLILICYWVFGGTFQVWTLVLGRLTLMERVSALVVVLLNFYFTNLMMIWTVRWRNQCPYWRLIVFGIQRVIGKIAEDLLLFWILRLLMIHAVFLFFRGGHKLCLTDVFVLVDVESVKTGMEGVFDAVVNFKNISHIGDAYLVWYNLWSYLAL